MNEPHLSHPQTPPWRHGALIACMFLTTAAFGFLQPFVPLYLAASGLTIGRIGVVIGVGTALTLLAQPLMGRLSDQLDARRPLMVAAALTAGSAYAGYTFAPAGSLGAFLVLTFLGVNGTQYLNAVGGVLVGRIAGRAGGGAAYAGYRVWGSVGYIIVALATGLLVNQALGLHPGAHAPSLLGRAALTPVFRDGFWLFALLAVAAVLVPDPKRAAHNAAPSARPILLPSPLTANIQWFLLALFLYQFALYGASSYLSLYLKALGATPLWITAVFAAGVVCEVLVMKQAGRLTDRYGRRPALAVAFVLMPLRLLAYIPAHTPLAVLCVQSLHGLNFGIMGAISVVFINDLATDQGRGAAQARLFGVQGFATALSPVACGFLAQHFGIGWMFALMSGVGMAGAAVFLMRVRESHPSPLPIPLRGPACFHPLLRLLSAPLALF